MASPRAVKYRECFEHAYLLRGLEPRIGLACHNSSRISTNSSSITISVSFSITISICNSGSNSSGGGGGVVAALAVVAMVGAGAEDVLHDPTYLLTYSMVQSPS